MAGLRLVRLTDFEEALPVSPSHRAAYQRRFVTLFVDDAHPRQGGLGKVLPAVNARGERLAVKMPLAPKETPGQDGEDGRDEAGKVLRREYEVHRSLNGMQGLPHLYGYGYAEGTPVIVMEWVSGCTLKDARGELAVDDEGRLSALTVARLGLSVFELLVQMEHMGQGIVHRDLSPSNILIRTDHLSLAEQAQEGSFDLCLVDLGSADDMQAETDTSLTGRDGVVVAPRPTMPRPRCSRSTSRTWSA